MSSPVYTVVSNATEEGGARLKSDLEKIGVCLYFEARCSGCEAVIQTDSRSTIPTHCPGCSSTVE